MKTTVVLAIASLMVSSSLAVGHDYAGLFGKCTREKSTFDCLKRRALSILESAIQDRSSYAINEYISVAKDPKFVESPESRSLKNETLDEQLEDKFYRYISSRSLQLTIPGDVVEGRKKKDKGGMLMMAGLAMAGMMAQLAMGKIALIAGTALLTAKIALVLSAIIGLKKLASSGGGHEVIYATASEHHGGGGGSYGGGWQRSFGSPHLAGNGEVYPIYANGANSAQDLAYSGQKSHS